ncbi:sacsin-like [Pseudophryne corroboree]|uniref:sacsin-like n=1 Tax=Pseudophryne corroboree TaxID=495146 RepID=UPI00308156CA
MDFFQRAPPFLIQLQNILRKYPDGGQILKELIQNADDAKASEVIFIYDEREYGTETLHSSDLHVIQGPSLLAYNNETFTERDWEGIQKPGDSIKRKDPNTVGRFGLGFNSVYHITDHPTIFSGKYLGILDPQEKILQRGGCLWNIERGRKCVEEFKDQFQPFQLALEALDEGCWEDILNSGYFNGTLFRFPLRLCPSEISDNIYSTDRVQELFESFMKDASISLLFLRHIKSVSLKKIDRDGVLLPLLTVNVCTEETFVSETADLNIETHFKVTSLKCYGKAEEECKWLVTASTVQENLFPELTELSYKLCNRPTLDLAYPLSKPCMDLFGGRLSCVLPLPDKEENRTGLPCLINGCFDLTDDRRGLKWLEIDQQHDEAAKWNHMLVEQILPLLYRYAIKNAVSLVKLSKLSAEMAYNIWPDPEMTAHKGRWHDLVKELALLLVKESVFQTIDETQWINAAQAVFLQIENGETCDLLEELLLLLNVPLVKVPEHVYSTIQLAKSSMARFNIVSPGLVRKFLHMDDWLVFSNEKKLLLLKYVISDGLHSELLNLQLLPLSDGTFTSFQNTESNGMVYIDNDEFPRMLLPGLAHRFIPKDLPDDLFLFFTELGRMRAFKNLLCLDKELICRKLCEALPQRWSNSSDTISWHPGDLDNPPMEWISTIWSFLQRYDHILHLFENQPIVPLNRITESSSDIQLARLKKDTALFYQNCDGHNLADCITVLLEKAGCTIIRHKYSLLWHKDLHLYVLVPTPNNVLQAFSHLNLNQILEILKNASKKNVRRLANFFSQALAFTSSELNCLYKLPIFCTAPCITPPDSELVAAGHLRAIDRSTTPAVLETLVLPNIVITSRDESDQRLLQLMNITLLRAADLALLIVRAIENGTYTRYPDEAQNAMVWILRNGYVLFNQNDQLKLMCKSLNFIPCHGKLNQPCVLYDPTIDILKELFESEKFPPDNYHEDSILLSLRLLGLQDSIHKIKPDDVLEIAERLSQAEDCVTSLQKAEALVKVCNDTMVLSQFNKHNLGKVCSLSWVPVNTNNPQTILREPENLRNMMYRNIVEFSMSITNCFNEKASAILGLSLPPPPEKVVENLQAISICYKEMDQYSLYRRLHDIYKYMQDHINQFYDILEEIMIWNGESFSYPTEVVLSYPEGLDLSSSVKKVQSDFLIYKDLFARCGVNSTLPEDEVIQILHALKHRLDSGCSDSGTSKDLKLAVSILDWMKTNSVPGTDDLPIPVQLGSTGFSLQSLSDTLYCDMENKCLTATSTDRYIVHEDISVATARYLNIQLLSTSILNPEYFELWGPSEPVTLRIKNILREYSEHVELFKEIIQNADDAEATVCYFLVDMRQNSESRHSLIDPGMARCHGPALWSYNNSKFTDLDFINITRIGAATKETQKHKIGKFGLGFNTVYHITDVPSIMSGSKILIFDPNVNHLQKHITSNNPGIKLDLQKNPEVLEKFSDQFQPYSSVFGCKLTQPFYFDGTLFRLPFRTEEEAGDSDICHQAFSGEQINIFMKDFEGSTDTLVFLKNVKELHLRCINNSSGLELPLTRVHLQKEKVQRLAMSQNAILQQEQVIVSEYLGVYTSGLDINSSNIIKIVGQQISSDEKYYLTQSSLGIQESFKMFMEDQEKFSLPVGGAAFPLKKNENTGKWIPDLVDFNGTVFCFLPLPVSSGLPFHINGSFSVMSNRKSLWDTTVKGEWNKKLLSDAVLVAVLTALSQLERLNQNGNIQDFCYHTFWPDVTKVNTHFTEVVKSFYHAIAFGFENSLPALFSNGHECCTIKHACFLELDSIRDETIQYLAKKLFTQFLKKPYLAIDFPGWVKNSFRVSNCAKGLENNLYNHVRFYREIIFENLDSLDAEDRNTLVLHAIDLQTPPLDNLLVSKPCIPTSSHGKLQFIAKLVHPLGKVSALYDPEEGCFPEGAEFLKPERLHRLQTLGMLKDELPMKELLMRACKIKAVWEHDRDKALKQIGCILELLNDLLQQNLVEIQKQDFQDLTFLPAVPPQSITAQLKDLMLTKSTDLYHYKHKALVCMVKPVLSEEHLGSIKLIGSVWSFLGMDHPPSVQIVISQLQQVCTVQNVLNPQETFQIVLQCYNYLNKLLEKKPNYTGYIKEKLSCLSFIYVDSDFVPLNVVAHKLTFDAFPYLHQLPKPFEAFRKLWDCVGIRTEFSFKHYISALEKMAMKHRGIPLSQNELRVALNLINSLYEITDVDLSSSVYTPHIFVPDKQCILRHVDKIFYNDTPWLPCEEEVNFCHDQIPRAVLSLGVKTKRHRTLQKLKISNLFKWVSEFGAKEDLTTRIKNIIKEYSSKKDILKELIQNADDAKATEIHFVLDCRTHARRNTFGNEWHPLQGPALCVYNNQKFDTKDIDGIQQLGVGGKQDNLDKTGKFGLGFNSVYHITDCPSFVTGDTIMCVFDPNQMFLETADDNSPGGMFNVNNEFRNTFQDVYNTFLPSVFNLQEGTIFRLPLRMAETVSKSKISNQTSSLQDIRSMCEDLDKDADSLLLFLNNIRNITFSEVSNTGHIKQVLSIKTKIDDIHEKALSSFQERFSKVAENRGLLAEASPLRVSFDVEITHSRSETATRWLVVRQLGMEGIGSMATLKKISDRLHQALIPHGSIAACLTDSIKGRAFCTLPLPVETGLPVHINANFIVDMARRDISKEDGDSPKTAWNMFLLSSVTAPLYCCLLECLREKMIPHKPCIFKSFDSCKLYLDRFLHFFPTVTKSLSPHWHIAVHTVYLTISKNNKQVIPVYKVHENKQKFGKDTVSVQWSNIGQVSIAEEPFFFIPGKIEAIEKILHNINMRLAYGGHENFLGEAFKAAAVNVLELSPQTLCDYLRQIQLFPRGDTLPAPVSMSLLRDEKSCKFLLNYCLELCSKKETLDLQGVPLLVTVDGMLNNLDKHNPKFASEFHPLFPDESSQFAKDIILYRNNLVKEGFYRDLTVENSAVLVKNHLGPIHEITSTTNGSGLLLPQDKVDWFKMLWSFFKSEIQKQKAENQEELFIGIISLYYHWAIVPVCFKKDSKTSILSPSHFRNICSSVFNYFGKYLFKLGFPKLELSVFPEEIISCIRSQLLDTENVEVVIKQLNSRSDLHWELMENFELDMLLWNILSKLASHKNRKSLMQMIQSLPLFENHQGKRKCLTVYQNKYILDTAFVLNSLNLSEIDPQTIFLKNTPLNKEVGKYMGIPLINDLALLTDFLLRHLASLSDNQLLDVLSLALEVQHLEAFRKKEDYILTTLKSVRLIRDKQGVLQQASHFYDKTVAIFSTLELQEWFIPDNLSKIFEKMQSQFYSLMRKLGMKCSLSEADFIRFATMIQKDSKGTHNLKSLIPKAKALFKYLLAMNVEELSSGFAAEVGNISFVIPSDVKSHLKALHPSYTENVNTVALHGSLLAPECYEPLVWTSMSRIKNDSKCSKKMQTFLRQCGVHHEPPIEQVIENVKNVCKSQCDSKELQEIRCHVLKEMYNFLQKKGPDIDITPLENVPFILVDDCRNIAEKKQVVFSLQWENNLQPYLYKLPPLLACYSALFQKVGVEAEPSVFHFANVLSTIYKETLDKKSLHANLIKTVSEAIHQLFKLVEIKKAKNLQNLKTLYLLATDGKLYESSSLVLNDCRSRITTGKLKHIFKFVNDWSCDLYTLQNLMKCLPVDIRPRMLSDITDEFLDVNLLKLCTYGEDCLLKRRLTEILLSLVFQDGLICLLRHQSSGKMTQEEATKKCGIIFGKLEIICCLEIKTFLMYEDKPLDGTQMLKTVDIKCKESCCKLYLEHSESMVARKAMKVADALAKQINILMENVLTHNSVQIVREMLTCEDANEIIEVLKEHNLQSYNTGNANAFSLPNAGEKIPSEWYDCLDMSILNTFKVDDYVGYLDPLNKSYLYAIIIEELDNLKFEGCEMQMYRINIGQDKMVDVSVFDLYHFKRSVSQSMKTLVLHENPQPQEEIPEKWHTSSMEEIKKEIDLQLSKIWGLPTVERMKAIRRLYLKYHPDKNIGQEDISTDIFKYLQQRIKVLESGGKLSHCHKSTNHSGTSSSSSKFWANWDEEAFQHKQNRERFSHRTRYNYDFWGYHSNPTRPNPPEAERWLRQAMCDMKAAEHDVGHHHTEWVFYKVHQAVEKALFAAQYMKSGKTDKGCGIVSLAEKVSHYCSSLHSIGKHVLQMEIHGVDKQKTQYPNYHTPPGIPNNRCASDLEKTIITLARNVLQKIELYVLK